MSRRNKKKINKKLIEDSRKSLIVLTIIMGLLIIAIIIGLSAK